MNYEIRTGIARPGPQPSRGPRKFPLEKMTVGSYLIVPKSERKDGDTDRDFRNRITQSVRTYKQGVNAKAHLVPGYDEDTYVPVEFSVFLLDEPPAEHADAWEAGDIGIWRDS